MRDMYNISAALFGEAPSFCKNCGRPLTKNDTGDLCPVCRKTQLFSEVREYIRENDVREEDVAEHFHIPIEMVRDWIKEGRITYKGDGSKQKMCEVCGRPIEVGSVCLSCRRKAKQEAEGNQKMRQKNFSGTAVYDATNREDVEMRFLNKGKDRK